MEQINYNFVNRTKKSLYSHNSVSNYNQLTQKNYVDYLKQNNKLNVKSVSIYNPNNPLTPEISHQNTNNLNANNIGKDMVERIAKYYSSYSSKSNNAKNKYSYIKDDIVNQYSLKQNLQGKNYMDYLQTKRNTYGYQDKTKVNNDIQKINTDVNEYKYNKYNNKNLYNNLRDKINNSYDKNKLINKLNSSKKNEIFMEEDHEQDNVNYNVTGTGNGSTNDLDISIEYTNAPIIQSKRSNFDNALNVYTNDNNDFSNIYKYSKIKNINSSSYKNNNDYLKKRQKSKKKNNNNNRINFVNSPSYFSNSTNKNNNIDIFNNNNYDISITNINNNYNNFLSNEKKYNYLINRKKQDLLETANTHNLSKNDIKYEYDTYNNNNNNLSLEKYKRNSNSIIKYGNDSNNNNLNKSKIRVNINNNQINSKNNQNRILKTDIKTNNDIKNISIQNNINSNVLNRKINQSNIERKNTNNYNNIKNDPQLKRYNNKSKRDIFHNSEYSNIKFNIPEKNIKHIKQIKSNSPNSKNSTNHNNFIEEENLNFQKLSMNYSVNLNNFNNNINISSNIHKNSYNANVFDPKFSYINNTNININDNNNNKRNIINRQKILMVDDKNYRMISPYSSVDIDKFEKSDLKYNIKFNSCIRQNSKEKISNLSDYYNDKDKEGLSYLEPKNKTSRQDNKYSGQKILLSNENLGKRYLHSYKSTKNMIKKNDNVVTYNVNSERKSKCTSPKTNNIFQYNLNNNKINNNYNIINIDIDKYKPSITPKKIVNKIESSNTIKNSKMAEYISNTNPNNNEFLRNEKKLSNLNNSKIEDCSLLKSINNYKQTYNNPVKLYKKEIKENKDKRTSKEKKIYESINNINNIYNKKEINNYSKKENNLNMNSNKNRIKKYNSLMSNNKKFINHNNSINSKTISNRGGKNKNNNIFYNNNIKNNNNFININSNIPNLNLLNIKSNNSISISSEKKEKYNIIEQEKNFNYASTCESKEKYIHHKNNRSNLKHVADELLEKNKNLKNISKLKPAFGKTKINNNYLSPNNGPSFIKTNTIRYNENNMNKLINSEDNTKSYKNFLYKSNNGSNNENNIKKQLMPNKSELHIIGNNIVTSQNMNNTGINNNIIINNSTEIINKDNINNYKDNSVPRNSNINNKNNTNNRGLIKTLKIAHEISNLNLVNYYKKINVPLTSTNNSIQLYNIKNKNKNLSPNGVYIKPYCALPLSKSKSNIKSKSEIKVKNRNKKNNIITSLNKNKLTSKSLNSEINFNTTTFFYQKGDYIKNQMNSLNILTAGSLNTSAKNNFSSCNFHDNDFSYDNLEKEKYEIQKQLNNYQMKKINSPIKKTQSFIFKIYNYFIKPPKIEKCHFIESDKRFKKINNNKSNRCSEKSFKNNKLNINLNTNNTKRASSLVKEIFISGTNNYEEEKINESSQNGFLVTFGDANSNKKNIENNINNINNISRTNIENIINNIAEDSDYEIYKSIQQSQNINENNILNIYNAQFNTSDDYQDYDSFRKDKNINNELFRSTNQTYGEYKKKMSKTFKNKSKSKYNLENTEKGLKILGKIAQRRGIKNNRHHLEFNSGKDEKKYKGTDKLNSEREIMLNNNDKKIDSDNKRSRSVNKDIMKGISKIANILGKNKDDKGNNESIDDGDTHEDPKVSKDNYNNYSKNESIKGLIDYDEKIMPRIRTFPAKTNKNLCLSNSNSNSNNNINVNDNLYFNKNIRYSQSMQKNITEMNKIADASIINKYENELTNPYDDRNLRLKDTSISDSIINQYKELLSYKEDESNSNKNIVITNENNYLEEELDNYLNQIKAHHSRNIIKYDMIYILNLLVEKNYKEILTQITEMILFEKNSSIFNENKILNKNDKIIENEHIFKEIIFKKAMNEIKYTNLYTKLCNDLNTNISFELRDQKNLKNNKERNLKLIINDECISILNNFKTLEIKIKDKESEEYILLKNKIIGYVNFVYELINIEMLKQQFGFYVLEQFYKIYNDNCTNLCKVIKDIFLEGIIILINKIGKLVLEKNNKKLIENINNYIKNNLYNIINNKNNIPNCLKYKIINLLIKRDNQWKEHLFEILKEEEKEKNQNMLSKLEIKENDSINDNKIIKSNNINKNNNNEKKNDLLDVKKAIIEEDLFNYISYYTEENNKGEIDIKKDIDKSYNWKAIDELINTQNFGLESIINYFLSICANRIYEEKKLLMANDYIKNIIEYYSNSLSQRAKDFIHNEMIKTFLNINQYVDINKNMHKILGNLLYILIDNKLYHIKYFNNYLKLDKQTQINLAIITRYCIISSGKFAKKYLNDFKQTKLFINSEIFNLYVNDALKDLFYFFK